MKARARALSPLCLRARLQKKGKIGEKKLAGFPLARFFCVSCSSLHVFCNGEERIGVEMEVKRVRIDSVGSPPSVGASVCLEQV